MSPIENICKAVRNSSIHLWTKYGGKYKMHKKAGNPFKIRHDPELDTSPGLDSDAVSYYLTIVGILRWMVKLERIDIITKVPM